MGVKNLWDILESCKKTIPLHHLQNKRVCVDLSCWIVQLHNVNKSHCSVKDKLYLKSLFHRLRALIALNCSLIFVIDGSIPAIKLSTYRRRLNGGNEPILDAGNPHNLSSLKRNMGSEFSCMIKEAKSLGVALGIPSLDGLEEAEAQCALLNSESLCDGCFTSDSDVFLFGARTIYREICLEKGGYVVCYEMDDIERKLGFGRNSLISLAILLGSDYSQRIRGIGPESACQIVKSIGNSAILQRFAAEGLSIVCKQNGAKKDPNLSYKENRADFGKDFNGHEHDLPANNVFLQVINAYLRPKCHSADSKPVQRVLALYPFNRFQLHKICALLFGWPPERTDEYILPKIAERNLRRLANLRSSSHKLGIQLPITEMPVKCPVLSIVKQRKIRGRDYFEVSWDEMNGLSSSAVPADLVESACPEKIAEFQQRKAEKQKLSRRAKQRNVDTTEIDRRLEELMLNIEHESTGGALLKKTISTPIFSQRMHLHTEAEGVERKRCPGVADTEIVDLVSPPVQVRELSRSADVVIELSDTDTDTDGDVSPEHARKARELRLFVASVRDE